MKPHFLVALAMLVPVALAACGVPSTSDFVQQAAMSDMYEVEAGKIAATKGQSDAVKRFGQHMVEAHLQTTEQLKGVIQAQNIKVELPSGLDAQHQLMIDDLTAAHEKEFDKTYAKQQVKTHEAAVKLFSRYAEKGDDAVVKAFAAKILPEIKQHLEEAKKLAR
jgi:putative membrane protein